MLAGDVRGCCVSEGLLSLLYRVVPFLSLVPNLSNLAQAGERVRLPLKIQSLQPPKGYGPQAAPTGVVQHR